MSPLSAKDAAFFYPWFHGSPSSTDQHLVYAFAWPENGGSRTDAVRDQFARRYHLAPFFHRRLERVPGDLGHPLVRVDPTFDPARVVGRRVDSWRDALSAVGDIVRVPLDVRRHLWEVTVLDGFTDGPEGTTMLVVVHASHSLCAGFGLSLSVQTVLFDGDLPVPDLPDPDVRSRRRAALRGLARIPADVARSARAAIAFRRHGDVDPPRTTTPLIYTAVPHRDRAVEILAVDGAGVADPLSRTLSAISSAMADHAHVHGDANARAALAAYVTLVLPPSIPWSSTNRFVSAAIPFHADVEDTVERARAIRASVSETRKRMFTPEYLARYEVVEELPPAVVSRLIRRGVRRPQADGPVGGHTVVSSAVRPATALGGIGHAYRFSTGFPMLTPGIVLTHSVAVIGEHVTIGVLADPGVLPDFAGYVARLRDAVRRDVGHIH
ncbi:wax ester/triacylglycerol synthase domain-containing protein [Rhodococcoides corynebacterioides]|uniref:wax ester/triacylglycerol synthase domain-containing protein n=1 Tax=Rhodococcoides corynebacterioides TaxID=53972 RepID=UPI00147145B7|nr:wax ester/triacylglycerol synthase domain-containing protein [Rhodococcus corynebacterioides]